jgi:hypothetical protein
MERVSREMNEPASKEDVKALVEKLDQLGDSFKGLRDQNSAEHGSLFTKMTHLTNLMTWLKEGWRRFSILPDPPEDRTKPGTPPKDDTQ